MATKDEKAYKHLAPLGRELMREGTYFIKSPYAPFKKGGAVFKEMFGAAVIVPNILSIYGIHNYQIFENKPQIH